MSGFRKSIDLIQLQDKCFLHSCIRHCGFGIMCLHSNHLVGRVEARNPTNAKRAFGVDLDMY